MAKAKKDIQVQVKQNYALLLWKEGNLSEAIKITEEIIEDYKNTVIYGNLGYFYILDGQKEKALEFNQVLFLNLNNNFLVKTLVFMSRF